MPPTTTRVSGAVSRLLQSGQISRIDEVSGVIQTLHADCPDDGTRANVRRMSRELGGPVMEVIMRCPACFKDFVAGPESLYVHPGTSRASALKGTATAASKGAGKSAPKAAAKKTAKSAGVAKTTAKAPAKRAATSTPKTAAKKGTKAAGKAASAKKGAAKAAGAAKRSGARSGRR